MAGSVETPERNPSIALKMLCIPAQPGVESNARTLDMVVVGYGRTDLL